MLLPRQTLRLSNTLRSTNFTTKRYFTPSAANMVIKTYFDLSWTGPEVQVDKKGNVTSTGAVKGKSQLHAPRRATAPRAPLGHLRHPSPSNC